LQTRVLLPSTPHAPALPLPLPPLRLSYRTHRHTATATLIDRRICDGTRKNATMAPPGGAPLYSIILPTYNERENLPIIFHLIDTTLTSAGLAYEVVIVEDSSPDGTLAVAESLRSVYGPAKIKIITRRGKLGLGSAYGAGLAAVAGDRVVLMDADLSHHPKFIPAMAALMDAPDRPDVVTGTRYAAGGGVSGWSLRRKLTSRGANFLAGFLLGSGVSDLTGSFRLYTRAAIGDVLPRVESKGYAFQMEVMIRAVDAGYTVREVPITFVDRVYGSSKLGSGEIVGFLKGLLNLFFTT